VTILSPTQHRKSIILNSYITAAPLLWFLNIVYSQALLVNVASQLFTQPKRKKAGKVPVKLWGMSLPIQSDGQRDLSYQFWVIQWKMICGTTNSESTTAISHFGKGLVDFFSRQFDSMREDKATNIQEGLVSKCKTLYIALYNSVKQTVPTIVAAVQYCSSNEGTFISWMQL
jgi:hypothetical protein